MWTYVFAIFSLIGFIVCNTPFQTWLLIEVLLFMFLAMIEERWLKSFNNITKNLITFFVIQFLGRAVILILISIRYYEISQVVGKVGITIALLFDIACPPFFWLSSWAHKVRLIHFFWFSTFIKILPLKLLFIINDHYTLTVILCLGAIHQIYNILLDIPKFQSSKRWAVTLFIHRRYISTLFLCFSVQFPNITWLSYLIIFFVLSLRAILWRDGRIWIGGGLNIGYTFGVKPWITLLSLVGFPPRIIFFKKLQFYHIIVERGSIAGQVFTLNVCLRILLMICRAVLIFLTGCVWWKSACNLDKGETGAERGCPVYLAGQIIFFLRGLSTISYLGFLFF